MSQGKKSVSKSTLLPDDRQFLVNILGEDQVKKLETDAGARGKVLESAGVNFKSDTEVDFSAESALMLAVSMKMFGDVVEALNASTEAVKSAASVVEGTDDRLAQLESKVERQNLLLMGILAPQHASKSIFTQLTPEETQQLANLQKADESQKPPVARKSLLEQLAEQAGALPISG